MPLPLVTCLCLTTKNRSLWLPRAVKCFREQDYPNKELLIVADSVDDADVVFEDVQTSDNIAVMVPAKPSNIGEKRNLGVQSAFGDFVANWDDDDWSAPGRLMWQVSGLCGVTLHDVTGFSSMKFTDGDRWYSFQIGAGFVIGSSLCYRREWALKHPFPEVQIGEDAGFCDEASRAGILLEVPDLNLMFASIHEGNTSKRDFSKPEWTLLERGFRFPGI